MLTVQVINANKTHVQITDGTKQMTVTRQQLEDAIKNKKVTIKNIRVKCLDKQRDIHNNITAYLLSDETGKQMAVAPQQLKTAMFNYQVECINLTLTSDGRLVDTSEKLVDTPKKVDKVKYSDISKPVEDAIKPVDAANSNIQQSKCKPIVYFVKHGSKLVTIVDAIYKKQYNVNQEVAENTKDKLNVLFTVSGQKKLNLVDINDLIEQLSASELDINNEQVLRICNKKSREIYDIIKHRNYREYYSSNSEVLIIRDNHNIILAVEDGTHIVGDFEKLIKLLKVNKIDIYNRAYTWVYCGGITHISDETLNKLKNNMKDTKLSLEDLTDTAINTGYDIDDLPVILGECGINVDKLDEKEKRKKEKKENQYKDTVLAMVTNNEDIEKVITVSYGDTIKCLSKTEFTDKIKRNEFKNIRRDGSIIENTRAIDIIQYDQFKDADLQVELKWPSYLADKLLLKSSLSGIYNIYSDKDKVIVFLNSGYTIVNRTTTEVVSIQGLKIEADANEVKTKIEKILQNVTNIKVKADILGIDYKDYVETAIETSGGYSNWQRDDDKKIATDIVTLKHVNICDIIGAEYSIKAASNSKCTGFKVELFKDNKLYARIFERYTNNTGSMYGSYSESYKYLGIGYNINKKQLGILLEHYKGYDSNYGDDGPFRNNNKSFTLIPILID